MNILSLIIKQQYFDEIIKGTKTQEFREIRPKSQKKYFELDKDGFVKEVDGVFVPRKYDAIQFYVGYNKNRAAALVEIKGAHIELIIDPDTGDYIEYELEGDLYTMAQVVYALGKVIEKN